VTWNDVGFFSSNSSKTNNFQVALRDQGAGNFDVEFRYDRLTWTTGNASGGSNGLGGTPAQAGYDAGNGTNFFTLPGSRTGAVLNLANTSNVFAATPGLWSFAIREGALPGETSANPLLPVVVNGSFTFDFNVVIPTQRIFIDPVVAIGYDYLVTDGPLITSVNFTTDVNDADGYDLFDINGNRLATGLRVGQIFTFANAVSGFRVAGIDPAAGLDPSNTNAFVTGLTFAGPGRVQMSQTPITFDTGTTVPPGNVPLPGSIALLLLGGLVMARKLRA
jgi:Nidogen-like